MKILLQTKNKAQTVLETLFVLTSMIFVTFMTMNVAVSIHTKNIATYAAFMGARSYQVYATHVGADQFQEIPAESESFIGEKGDGTLLSDLTKTASAHRVAEDIFTCALPWMTVPKEDQTGSTVDVPKTPEERCMEGKRKYEVTNVAKPTIRPFSLKDDFQDKTKLTVVPDGFSEEGREKLRFGIFILAYRKDIPFNIMGLFKNKDGEDSTALQANDESDDSIQSVYVPVLLNPGLDPGLKEADPHNKKPNFGKQ